MPPTKDERNTFSMMIEDLAYKLRISHLEAVTHYCEENGLEIEVAATLINDTLKSKLEGDGQTLRYLPRGSKLPI